jgi:hypothetical protein
VRVALLFIDGVGIGRRDPAINPLARAEYLLSQFDDGTGTEIAGGALHTVDATFGVPGRPQSATNQAALLTGEPAPRLLGKHLLGFPNPALRELISRASIAKRLIELGRGATFANAFPAGYLDAVGLPRRAGRAEGTPPARLSRKWRPSATAWAMTAGGALLRTLEDARAGEGLTNDLNGARARAFGLDAPERGAEEAAEILWRVASGNAFTLFEHSLADDAGHARDFEAAADSLGRFDAFAREVIRRRPADAAVVICSDHGNVEDLSTRNHTLNLVPVLSFGAALPRCDTLADVGESLRRIAASG